MMKVIVYFLIVFPGVLLDNIVIPNSIPCISASDKRILSNIYDNINAADRQFMEDLIQQIYQCKLEEEKKPQQLQQKLPQPLQQEQQCAPDNSWFGKFFESLLISYNAISTLFGMCSVRIAYVLHRHNLAIQNRMNNAIINN